MTLEDLGNFGEFLGAIGVIVSVLYLAIQIRQNTRSVRSSAYQSVVSSSVQMAAAYANDESLAELWPKGAREYSTLSEPERFRFGLFAYSVFRSYENLFFQYKQGAVEPDLWQGFRNMLVRDLKTPGLVTWWESQRNIFSSAFQRYVDELRR
jgi:hypothetical protein